MRHRKQRLNINSILKNKHNYRKQYKLHNEQMSKYDIQNLARIVASTDLNRLRLKWHVINKNDVRFTLRLFKDVISRNLSNLESQIIEYNEIPITTKFGSVIDKRILMRDFEEVNGFNLCFVLSLTTNEIVTAYWIEKDFNHEELNWSRYSSNFYMSV